MELFYLASETLSIFFHENRIYVGGHHGSIKCALPGKIYAFLKNLYYFGYLLTLPNDPLWTLNVFTQIRKLTRRTGYLVV